MLPDLLRRFPNTRPVLDRYGLRGCGGPLGPAESIGYFARAHGVDADRLITELHQAIDHPESIGDTQPTAPNPLDLLADTIYRRFFKAGIIVILTAGAAWGALLLWRIGFNRSFTAISIHDINAHGHAQIFGWVGLFVMGFAYQAFPRMRHTSLARPDLANMSFYLMVFGVFARAAGEAFHVWPLGRELAVAGGFAEVAAIGIFVGVLMKTFKQSSKPYAAYDAYILAALGFFMLQAVYDLGLAYATITAANRPALLNIVATYQAPLRDIQIHGFAMLMILGVGIRMFPALFGLPAPSPKRVSRCLVLLIAGIVGEAAFFLAMRLTGQHGWAIPMYAAMLLLAAATIALTWRWGAWTRPTESDRSVKFVRVAVTWLHISMVLLALAPIYMRMILPAASALSASGQRSVEIGFSHAYGGAVRHAITVGFISLMILGMAAKVVPTLNGVDIRRLRGLWVPFVLVNLGCLMRVGFQVATDFAEWAYPIAGVSGLLEVTGIAIWGFHLWQIMNGWKPAEQLAADRPDRITADDKVGLVVEWFPETLPVFLARGFRPLSNPVMRKTVARAISVRMAAEHHQLDVNELLAELNAAAFHTTDVDAKSNRTGRIPLMVLNHG